MLMLAGCATTLTGATRYIGTECQTFQIIHYSKDDTAPTQDQVKANNRVWHALCGTAKP